MLKHNVRTNQTKHKHNSMSNRKTTCCVPLKKTGGLQSVVAFAIHGFRFFV